MQNIERYSDSQLQNNLGNACILQFWTNCITIFSSHLRKALLFMNIRPFKVCLKCLMNLHKSPSFNEWEILDQSIARAMNWEKALPAFLIMCMHTIRCTLPSFGDVLMNSIELGSKSRLQSYTNPKTLSEAECEVTSGNTIFVVGTMLSH